MPPAVTPKEFLQTLWGVDPGWAELSVIDKNGILITAIPMQYPDYVDSLLTESNRFNEKHNVYMGVCLRRERWPRKTGRKGSDGTEEIEKRGTEANALSSMVAWMDLDFEGSHHKNAKKTIKKEIALKMLSEFPLKPSIIVKSGGDGDSGVHVYWLFKEPATDGNLLKVKALNKALTKYFVGADSVADLARVLRLPGSVNWNLKNPKRAYVSYWHPENQWSFLDFEEELGFDLTPETSISAAQHPGPLPGAPAVELAQTTFEPRIPPTIAIADDVIQKMGELLSKIWDLGTRHELALHVAGWFAHQQIVSTSTKRVIAIASDIVGGSTSARLKDVDDTYRNFDLGKSVTGRPSIEQMISKGTPAAQQAELKIIRDIEKLIPKPPKKKKEVRLEPDFEINKVVKFDSRPARYQVHIKKAGKEYIVPCELDIMTDIKRFRKSFFETSVNQFINSISQWRWEQMISEAPVEVVAAPAEATTTGSIQTALESWLEERREKPDPGELKTFPGYDEAEVYFTLEGLKSRLKDRQIRCTDREITHILQDDGWKPTRRRMNGSRASRLWSRSLSNGHSNGNGNGHGGNGHPSSTELPSTDLFNGEPTKMTEPEGLD